MKVWVVGGAGYIGSHVCQALLQAGIRVGVFDNLSTGRRENLPPGIDFCEGDLLDSEALRKSAAGGGWDGVIHLAALKAADESMEFPERYSRNNISGTINLLQAVLEAGIPAVVFSSSAAVYGAPEYLPLDENHPTRPGNFYGHTKRVIEGLLEWYGRLKGLRSVSLRYFNAAGYDPEGRIRGLERNPANLLPVVMETAMGWRSKLRVFGNDYPTRDGTCIRDYVHVSDLADAHVKAMEHLARGGGSLTLNLGSGSGITVMEMIRKATEVTGREIPFEIAGRRAGDATSVVASSEAAEKILGWKARCSDVETLLRTTWKAYQDGASTRA